MSWILSLYIGVSIFGVGVTIADLFGAFSNLSEGGSDDGDSSGSDDPAADDSGDDGDSDGSAHSPSVLAHDLRSKPGTVLRLLALMRSTVFFSVGFGPVGWFATTQYSTPLPTLAWSLPVGLAVMITAKGLRKLFRKDLSSEIRMSDLIMESGTVTVSIGKGQIGKARLMIGGVYVERFSRAHDELTEISVGARVRVIDANDECVFVEEE